MLVNYDKPGAEDTEEAGADEDGQGDEKHEHVDFVGLLKVKIGRDKVTLARRVVAGETGLRRVVSAIFAKISEERLKSPTRECNVENLWKAVHSSESELEQPSWFIFSLLSL